MFEYGRELAALQDCSYLRIQRLPPVLFVVKLAALKSRDLEKLADLLDIAIINLKEAGHFHELGDGSLYNKLQRKLSESMLARYHRWVFENSITEGVDTVDNLKRFWEVEETSLGKPTPIVQIQDQLAMRKVDGSLNYDQNMYRVSIPWKEDKPMLPDNYSMALKRLQNTEKRLQKSPNIGHAYSDIIKQYVAKGYVRKVPENESYSSKWYLPHFPVIRPDKDTTKIRIVFDASAKCQGTSLITRGQNCSETCSTYC